MKISHIAKLACGSIIVGFALTVATSQYGLKTLKIGGPLYQQIVLGKDLVADILPPPEYIIEAYLEATLLTKNPKTLVLRRKRLDELKHDYDERHNYWSSQEVDPDVKFLLTKTAHEAALQFWRILNTELIPAIERNDENNIGKAYDELSSAYSAQRQIIDRTVSEANKMNEIIVRSSKEMDWSR